ncbi:hypothetical protein RF55_7807 [Lasius niger]|uniref:Uncharacterized protein n=1 Tax=Lasius niger TaxID=67767 RepID=A0A0J7NIA3_LASNI|nr:hypothetical protein RF55_7807 [Lasius niger]
MDKEKRREEERAREERRTDEKGEKKKELERTLERKVALRGVEERIGDEGKSILLVVLEKEEDRDEVLEKRGEIGRRWRMSVDEYLTREERKMNWRIKEKARGRTNSCYEGEGRKEKEGVSGKREDEISTEGKEEEEKKDEETKGRKEKGKERMYRDEGGCKGGGLGEKGQEPRMRGASM